MRSLNSSNYNDSNLANHPGMLYAMINFII